MKDEEELMMRRSEGHTFSGRRNQEQRPHVGKGLAWKRERREPHGQKSGQQEGERWVMRSESKAWARGPKGF